jgi:hypothetical protein
MYPVSAEWLALKFNMPVLMFTQRLKRYNKYFAFLILAFFLRGS